MATKIITRQIPLQTLNIVLRQQIVTDATRIYLSVAIFLNFTIAYVIFAICSAIHKNLKFQQ